MTVSIIKTNDALTKPVNESKSAIADLNSFVQHAAESVGLGHQITLKIVSKSGVAQCDVSTKTIYLSSGLASAYHTNVQSYDKLIDQLPNDPIQIRKFLNTLTDDEIEYIRLNAPDGLSDLELEATLSHEIGHIYENHSETDLTSVHKKHRCEFEADAFAARTSTGRKGLIRGLKRMIVMELASKGKKVYQKLKETLLPQSGCTHPSYDERLKRALQIDHNYNKQGAF